MNPRKTSNWIAASVIAGTLGLSGLAVAEGSQPEKLPPGAQKSTIEKGTTTPPQNLRTFSLKVTDVDKAEHKVNLEAQVSPEANIRASGRQIGLDQLEKGDQVRASFDPATGEIVKLDVIKADTAAGGSGAASEEQDKKSEHQEQK